MENKFNEIRTKLLLIINCEIDYDINKIEFKSLKQKKNYIENFKIEFKEFYQLFEGKNSDLLSSSMKIEPEKKSTFTIRWSNCNILFFPSVHIIGNSMTPEHRCTPNIFFSTILIIKIPFTSFWIFETSIWIIHPT